MELQCSVQPISLCSSFLQEQKNWLRSTLIDVQSIDRVTVSVEYTITPFCSSHPNTFCADNIGVYVWESVSQVTTDLIPDPLTSNSSYRQLPTIRGQASGQTISLALQLTRKYIVILLVLQYIFYFHPLTNKFVSFFVYFSGITNQCPIILHCVIRFCKNRKIGYEVHLLIFTALTE